MKVKQSAKEDNILRSERTLWELAKLTYIYIYIYKTLLERCYTCQGQDNCIPVAGLCPLFQQSCKPTTMASKSTHNILRLSSSFWLMKWGQTHPPWWFRICSLALPWVFKEVIVTFHLTRCLHFRIITTQWQRTIFQFRETRHEGKHNDMFIIRCCTRFDLRNLVHCH